jgi:DNA transformation protein
MFGGQGIYAGEAMFAIEVGGELFLKADTETARRFEAAGSRFFTYMRAGRPATRNYWRLPDDGLDDPDVAAECGRLALAVVRPARSSRKKAADLP